MTLQELFNKCVEENGGNKIRGAQQFIVRAKKEIPDVKMNECMTVAGYEKKNEQTFRNNIVVPVRNRIAQIKFNVGPDAVKRLFGRTQQSLTDDEKQLKKNISSCLPARTRITSEKSMDHIDALIAE